MHSSGSNVSARALHNKPPERRNQRTQFWSCGTTSTSATSTHTEKPSFQRVTPVKCPLGMRSPLIPSLLIVTDHCQALINTLINYTSHFHFPGAGSCAGGSREQVVPNAPAAGRTAALSCTQTQLRQAGNPRYVSLALIELQNPLSTSLNSEIPFHFPVSHHNYIHQNTQKSKWTRQRVLRHFLSQWY